MPTIIKIKSWLYKASLFISILLLIGFSSVLPIDSIAQASQSENNALNTFIVVGALVAFAVVCIISIVGRMYLHKSCLKDIPRRYVPITTADLPHAPSRENIIKNMERSKELTVLFKIPKDPVIHPGLEPPIRCDDPNIEKLFPEYLNYKVCVKSVTETLKYKGIFLNTYATDFNLNDSFSDLIYRQFIEGNTRNYDQVQKAYTFIDLYESFQFSNKEIARDDFVQFVNLSLYFHDILMGNDTSKQQKQTNKNLWNESFYHEEKTPAAQTNNNDNNNNNQNSLPHIIINNNDKDYNEPFDLTQNNSNYDLDYDDGTGAAAPDEMEYFPESQRNPSYVIRRNSTSTVAQRIPSTVILDEDGEPDPLEPIPIQNSPQEMVSKVESYGTVIHH
ncbi:Dlt1p NDAI_0H02790 [Naumovozyma dairenensis CBS 421]|uniref:Defect at low temperature protein 1 n=1 Tax=Naumovozyma dairenensis (strain ATCC 10597 / BCRC 20456 / CBS 421 / NBRC 0211 / NRRL Y-12639) TaxID=1071378 RepID=G0WF92_NAUDC|nr:hypothetical protein NDAI_0H02790 [Naumovozyma dairenensis CBS 421]CCD26453.1 hypothetical protein NDAI_0H02790 [Naumovozyma dairenensis CBS 421]